MREPEEQIRSWYRYRCREARKGSAFSADGVSFDAFVRAVISQAPPPYAGIGSQYRMLTSAGGELLVHHLFAYEKPLQFRAFLTDRFGDEIVLKQKNVSPPADAPLGSQTRALLRAARAEEFDLYERLTAAGGHLRTEIA